MSEPQAMRELTRDELLDQRNHYMTGCGCRLRPTCTPHGYAGRTDPPFAVCADHEHVERRSGIDRRARRVIPDPIYALDLPA